MAPADRTLDGGARASADPGPLHLHCVQPRLDRPRIPDRDADVADLQHARADGALHRIRPADMGRLLADLPPGPAPAVRLHRRRPRDRRGRRLTNLGPARADDHIRAQLFRAVLAPGLSERPQPRDQLLPAGHDPLGQPARRLGDRFRLARRGLGLRAGELGLGPGQPRASDARPAPRHHRHRIGRGGGGDPAFPQPLSISLPDAGQRGAAEADRRMGLAQLSRCVPPAVRGDGVPADRGLCPPPADALPVPAHGRRVISRAPVGAQRRPLRGGGDAGDDHHLRRVVEGVRRGSQVDVSLASTQAVCDHHRDCSRLHLAGHHASRREQCEPGTSAERGHGVIPGRGGGLADRTSRSWYAHVQPVRVGRLPCLPLLSRAEPAGVHLR